MSLRRGNWVFFPLSSFSQRKRCYIYLCEHEQFSCHPGCSETSIYTLYCFKCMIQQCYGPTVIASLSKGLFNASKSNKEVLRWKLSLDKSPRLTLLQLTITVPSVKFITLSTTGILTLYGNVLMCLSSCAISLRIVFTARILNKKLSLIQLQLRRETN